MAQFLLKYVSVPHSKSFRNLFFCIRFKITDVINLEQYGSKL